MGGLNNLVTSIAAPTMIMTLAIADAIHILVSMFGFMRRQNSDEAISSFSPSSTRHSHYQQRPRLGFFNAKFLLMCPLRILEI